MDPGIQDPGSWIQGSWDPGQEGRRPSCGSLDPSAIRTPSGTSRDGRVPRPSRVARGRDRAATRPPRPDGRGGSREPEPHGRTRTCYGSSGVPRVPGGGWCTRGVHHPPPWYPGTPTSPRPSPQAPADVAYPPPPEGGGGSSLQADTQQAEPAAVNVLVDGASSTRASARVSSTRLLSTCRPEPARDDGTWNPACPRPRDAGT